ncbi:MAG: GNAT family N-acetyltransferase, partial [Bacteroidota bacterium]
SDTDPFIEMNQDPKVMEYFPSTRSPEETRASLIRFDHHFEKEGFGLYAVDLLSEKTFIGYIGLMRAELAIDFCPCIEIGWRLRKEFWRRGLASEGARRCLAHAQTAFKIPEVFAFTSQLNIPSQGVMKKIGMHYVKDFLHPSIDPQHPLASHVLYHILLNPNHGSS